MSDYADMYRDMKQEAKAARRERGIKNMATLNDLVGYLALNAKIYRNITFVFKLKEETSTTSLNLEELHGLEPTGGLTYQIKDLKNSYAHNILIIQKIKSHDTRTINAEKMEGDCKLSRQ